MIREFPKSGFAFERNVNKLRLKKTTQRLGPSEPRAKGSP